jgi:DNA-binding transcriptional ArsR family regulator
MSNVQRVPTVTLGAVCVAEVKPVWVLAVAGLLPVLDGSTEGAGRVAPALQDVPGWAAARALLVHGLALRDTVADAWRQDPASVPGDAAGGHRWLERRDDTFWRSVLACGAVAGLAYYDAHLEPRAPVERIRDGWPTRLPSVTDLLADAVLYREAVMAQALTWPVDAHRISDVMEPDTLHRTVAAALAACDEAVGGALALRWPTVPGPGPSAALLESWTGRPLPPNLREDLTAVTRLTLVPTHGLGATLTAYRAARHWIVWAEPAAPPESTELVAGGALQRVLQALADPVSYAVVEHLAAGHAHTGAGLAAVLGVHPSTVSRHLRALQEVGLIAATGTGGRVRYHVRVAALQSLAAGLGALADRATGIPESDP